MDIKPVKHYSDPGFPTRKIIDQHPELLRLVPRRWQQNALVITALGTLCALVTSCSADKTNETNENASRIAPIFQHGEGIGSFGCRATNPPVFLSEDEARQVIIEEAKLAGVEFKVSEKTLHGVIVPQLLKSPKKDQVPVQRMSLVLDGEDADKEIAFEYMSENEASYWGPRHTSTAYSISTIDASKKLRERLVKANPKETIAVFYDPFSSAPLVKNEAGEIDWNATFKNRPTQDELKKTSREELRKQVQDFVKWLKSEGVI